MTNNHTPDEILMKRALDTLSRGPMTVAGVALALQAHPKAVRQALHDLIFFGKAVQLPDGKRYQRVEVT